MAAPHAHFLLDEMGRQDLLSVERLHVAVDHHDVAARLEVPEVRLARNHRVLVAARRVRFAFGAIGVHRLGEALLRDRRLALRDPDVEGPAQVRGIMDADRHISASAQRAGEDQRNERDRAQIQQRDLRVAGPASRAQIAREARGIGG